MPRQFVGVRFYAGGQIYTYHNDGEPLAVGHSCRIANVKGGWKNVDVVSATNDLPAHPTKPIIAPDWIDRMTPEEARKCLADGNATHKAGDLFAGTDQPTPPTDSEAERLRAKSMKARV